MAENTGDAGTAGRFPPKEAPPARPSAAPAPPPRPPISNQTPAPLRPPTPPSPAIMASRSLWIASFVVAFLAIGVAFVARTAQVGELRILIRDLMPGESEMTLERAAEVIYWVCICALVVVIIVEALLLRLVMNRRRGARWALLIFLLVHAAVAVVADTFLAVGDAGVFVRLLLAAQFLLAALAVLVSFLPGSGRWLRADH